MKRNPLAWIAATALIAASPFFPVTAEAATPVPARTVAPADISAPVVVKHVDTDLDGDGARDSVDLTYVGDDQFTLSAITARKESFSVRFSSAFEAADPATPKSVWFGADAIDGHKGSELIVRIFNTYELQGHEVTLNVYTWRSGMLVAETAPTTPEGRIWRINSGAQQMARGYRFFTSHGHRYVDASRLTSPTLPGVRWTGRVTRSVWRHGAWVTLWTHRARATRSLAWGQIAIAGPKLLIDQLDADISGDGNADRVLVHRTGKSAHLVTVSASGHRASTTVRGSGDDPFIGAARVDGVAGSELLFGTSTVGRSHRWEVLSWRKGALTHVPGPLKDPQGKDSWYGADANTQTTNFALSTEGGSHDVVVGRLASGLDPQTHPVHLTKFVWDVDGWTEQAEWDAMLTAEQAATFHDGFTAPDLTSP